MDDLIFSIPDRPNGRRNSLPRRLVGDARRIKRIGRAAGALAFLAAAAAFFAPADAAAQASTGITFQNSAIGQTPPGFVAGLTGGGGPVAWIIVEDATAWRGRALAQTSRDKTGYRFPLCLYDGVVARDVDVAVRFKAVSGEVDRAAGLIVRAQDADDYYVLRANALEDNVNLYRVVKGRRSEIKGADAKVPSGQWQTLRLKVEGARFEAFFNDSLLFQAEDHTFGGAGRIGFWTKADSVTYFNDLAVTLGRE